VSVIVKIPKLKAVILPNKRKCPERPRLHLCLVANEENESEKVFFPFKQVDNRNALKKRTNSNRILNEPDKYTQH